MNKELQASSCRLCSGTTTVTWDDKYKIWVCSRCGWVDKEKGKKK